MWSLLLILSTFFDDNGGAGPTHKILSSCYLCPPQGLLDMVAAPGAKKSLRERLPLRNVFYTRLELLICSFYESFYVEGVRNRLEVIDADRMK